MIKNVTPGLALICVTLLTAGCGNVPRHTDPRTRSGYDALAAGNPKRAVDHFRLAASSRAARGLPADSRDIEMAKQACAKDARSALAEARLIAPREPRLAEQLVERARNLAGSDGADDAALAEEIALFARRELGPIAFTFRARAYGGGLEADRLRSRLADRGAALSSNRAPTSRAPGGREVKRLLASTRTLREDAERHLEPGAPGRSELIAALGALERVIDDTTLPTMDDERLSWRLEHKLLERLERVRQALAPFTGESPAAARPDMVTAPAPGAERTIQSAGPGAVPGEASPQSYAEAPAAPSGRSAPVEADPFDGLERSSGGGSPGERR